MQIAGDLLHTIKCRNKLEKIIREKISNVQLVVWIYYEVDTQQKKMRTTIFWQPANRIVTLGKFCCFSVVRFGGQVRVNNLQIRNDYVFDGLFFFLFSSSVIVVR